MPNDGLLIQTMLNSGLVQYPDAHLYKAATMLKPEERPTVPVSLVESDKKVETEATFDNRNNSLSIMKGGKAYREAGKHPQRLAAVLGHEAEHQRQAKQPLEAPAYKVQHEILKRLGEKDKHLIQRLMEAELRWRALENGRR